jgi:hypothetical protein
VQDWFLARWVGDTIPVMFPCDSFFHVKQSMARFGAAIHHQHYYHHPRAGILAGGP